MAISGNTVDSMRRKASGSIRMEQQGQDDAPRPLKGLTLAAGVMTFLIVATLAVFALLNVPTMEKADAALAAGNFDQGAAILTRMADTGNIQAQKKLYRLHLSEHPRRNVKTGEKYLIMAAEAGDADSQELLGKRHHEGIALQSNPKQAVYWLTKASAGKKAEAMGILGEYYLTGKTVVQDPERGLNLLAGAAELGDLRATGALGKIYYDGELLPRDCKKAEQFLSRSNNDAYPERNRLLGLIYYKGLGSGRSLSRAVPLLLTAGDTDDAETNAILGLLHFYGQGVEPDSQLAEKHLRLAADAGWTSAYCQLGTLYYDSGDHSRAAQYLEKAVEAGDTSACGKLGLLYYHGQGVEKDVKTSVLHLTRFALKHRDTAVNALLGQIYYHGDEGVPQDYHKAYSYLRLAADAQDIPSQTLLANLYYDGNGAARDYEKAGALLQRGVEARHPAALSLYGRMLFYGNGVEPEREMGMSLLRAAGEMNDKVAMEIVSAEEHSRKAMADFSRQPAAPSSLVKPVLLSTNTPASSPLKPSSSDKDGGIEDLPGKIFLWGALYFGMSFDECVTELSSLFRFAPEDVVEVKNYPDADVEAHLVYVGDWAVRLLLHHDALYNVDFFVIDGKTPEPVLPGDMRNRGVYLPYALHSKAGGIEFDIFDPEGPVYKALESDPDMDVRELSKLATYYLADCIKRANRRFDVIEARMPENFSFGEKDIPTSAMEFHYSLEPEIVKKASWQPDGDTPGYISYSTDLMFGM